MSQQLWLLYPVVHIEGGGMCGVDEGKVKALTRQVKIAGNVKRFIKAKFGVSWNYDIKNFFYVHISDKTTSLTLIRSSQWFHLEYKSNTLLSLIYL